MRTIWRKGPLATAFAGSVVAHAVLIAVLWHSRAAAVPADAGDDEIELVTVDLTGVNAVDLIKQAPIVPPAPVIEEPEPEPEPEPEAVEPEPEAVVAEPEPEPEAVEPEAVAEPEAEPEAVSSTSTSTSASTSTSPRPTRETTEPVTKKDLASGFAAFNAVPSVDGVLDGEPPPGIATDFNAPMPGEPTVTVLLRLDRLRGTMWAEQTEAILAPLPDYRTIVGDNKGSIYDLFDSLIMSSPRPQDVTATLVVGKIREGAAEQVMAFVDPDHKVHWTDTELGRRGKRPLEALPKPDDPRELLVPSPERLLLTRPEYLDDASWLEAVAPLEAASGAETGPFALASARGFPKRLRFPIVGSLPAPERVTASLTNAGRGFLVQGVFSFATDQDAEQFASAVTGAKDSALESFAAKRLLEGFGVYNAAKGLRLRQTGRNVTFATSVSILDARALMEMAAEWTATYYESKSKPDTEPALPPAPPPTPTPDEK